MTNISAEIFSPPTPPSNLCYNEYFNHTLLVRRLGDEGEGWPHTLKAKKLDFSNTLYLGLDLKTFYSSLMYCSILYVLRKIHRYTFQAPKQESGNRRTKIIQFTPKFLNNPFWLLSNKLKRIQNHYGTNSLPSLHISS